MYLYRLTLEITLDEHDCDPEYISHVIMTEQEFPRFSVTRFNSQDIPAPIAQLFVDRDMGLDALPSDDELLYAEWSLIPIHKSEYYTGL